jgi:hypothetical protein
LIASVVPLAEAAVHQEAHRHRDGPRPPPLQHQGKPGDPGFQLVTRHEGQQVS